MCLMINEFRFISTPLLLYVVVVVQSSAKETNLVGVVMVRFGCSGQFVSFKLNFQLSLATAFQWGAAMDSTGGLAAGGSLSFGLSHTHTHTHAKRVCWLAGWTANQAASSKEPPDLAWSSWQPGKANARRRGRPSIKAESPQRTAPFATQESRRFVLLGCSSLH